MADADEGLREDLVAEYSDETGPLTEQADPVLGSLWNNHADSVYDDI